MCFHISDQVRYALAPVIAGTAVMPIAKGALDRVGTRTVGGQQEQGHPRVVEQPLLNRLCFMDLIVIYDDLEPRILLGGILLLDDLEQVPKQGVGFPRPAAVAQDASRHIQRSGQGIFGIRPRGHHG
jgi:hypothetical protein